MVKQPPLTLAVHLDRSQPRCQVGLGGTVSGGPEPVFRALLCFCGGGQWAHGHVGAISRDWDCHPSHPFRACLLPLHPCPPCSRSLASFSLVGPLTLVWHLSWEGVLQTAARGGHGPLSRGHSMSRPLRPSVLLPRVRLFLLPRVRLFLLSCIHLFLDASLWSPVSLTWHLCVWGRNGEQDC